MSNTECLHAQVQEKVQIDSIPLNKDFNLHSIEVEKTKPNPGRAALLSAVFPGAGQFYNNRYLKMPFVYGGLIGFYTLASFNRKRFRCLRYALTLELEGLNPDQVVCGDLTVNVSNFNAAGLRSRRDSFRKNMELAYIGMSLVYIANVVDAYVDAHLQNFDINDDLSLQINPYVQPNENGSSFGLTFTLLGR